MGDQQFGRLPLPIIVTEHAIRGPAVSGHPIGQEIAMPMTGSNVKPP